MNAAQITTAINQRWLPYKYANGTWIQMTPSSYTRGDVNGDDNVNISDVTDLINYLLGGTISGFNVNAADCDQGGSINISDVTALINFLLSGAW